MSTVALPRRPRVPIWLRPLTRPTGEVQFGVLPGGPIVGGASNAEVRLLSRLDGSVSLEATYERARASGVSRSRWRELLTLTARLGVLADADEPVPLARHSSLAAVSEPYAARLSVVVDGAGPVAEEIAAVAESTASVTVVHRRPEVDGVIADPTSRRPDLVVLVGSPLVDPRRGNLWLRHGIPHLPVATAGPHTTVGPLVDGSAAAPCLWCLDRHRADRDEAWPTVLAQVTPDLEQARRPRLDAPVPSSAAALPVTTAEGVHERLPTGLGQLVAGTVALFVTRLAVGQLPPRGVSVEVSLPWPRMDHRRWGPHPLCPAHLEARREAELPPALGTERPAGLGRL